MLKTGQGYNELKGRLGKFIASEDAFVGMLNSQPQLSKEAMTNLSPLVNGITGEQVMIFVDNRRLPDAYTFYDIEYVIG